MILTSSVLNVNLYFTKGNTILFQYFQINRQLRRRRRSSPFLVNICSLLEKWVFPACSLSLLTARLDLIEKRHSAELSRAFLRNVGGGFFRLGHPNTRFSYKSDSSIADEIDCVYRMCRCWCWCSGSVCAIFNLADGTSHPTNIPYLPFSRAHW